MCFRKFDSTNIWLISSFALVVCCVTLAVLMGWEVRTGECQIFFIVLCAFT